MAGSYTPLSAALWTLAPLLIVGVAFYAMRGRWDLIFEHLRDGVRHVLAAVLMLGTVAGTVWTFSDGTLSLHGIGETLISVGGIAAALELGVIYTGWQVGTLDRRIQTARKADAKADLVAQRDDLIRWFYAVAAISAVANLIYRTQQLHSFWLALLPSLTPIVLVYLFTIKLRPIPQDYAEIGRQSTQRGLVLIATQAQAVMMRSLRKIGKGATLTQGEMAQLSMAVAFQRAYVSGEQQQALDQVIAGQRQGPQLLGATTNSDAGEWMTSADIMRRYGISERAAQHWMSQTPGRRRQPHSRSWEAPAATIYAAHGVPEVQNGSAPTRRRKRTSAPVVAAETIVDADILPVVAGQAYTQAYTSE